MSAHAGDTRELITFFHTCLIQTVNDPDVGLVEPIKARINDTDDWTTDLVVLTATAISQYALLLQQVAGSKESAISYLQHVLTLNDLEVVFEQEGNPDD